MKYKEKLIEILESAESAIYWNSEDKGFIQKITDHLLSNGVTFQNWIPVTERLPEHGQEVIVYSGNILKPTVFAYQFWNPKYDSWKHITHWMPLPEPPKEVSE